MEGVSIMSTYSDDIVELHMTLDDIYEECKIEGWDGYDAFPISELTLSYGHQFIEIIPDNIPLPDISVEPDGSLEFEWYNTPYRIVTLSLDSFGLISYAAIIDEDKISGDIELDWDSNMDTDSFPIDILTIIYSIYNEKVE